MEIKKSNIPNNTITRKLCRAATGGGGIMVGNTECGRSGP